MTNETTYTLAEGVELPEDIKLEGANIILNGETPRIEFIGIKKHALIVAEAFNCRGGIAVVEKLKEDNNKYAVVVLKNPPQPK
jgi:hypothetical protein